MNSTEITLTEEWVQIINDEDYFMQNINRKNILIKVQSNEPTDNSGVIILKNGDILYSDMISGDIWAKAEATPVSIVAKLTVIKG